MSFDKIVVYTQKQLKLISEKEQIICDIEKRELRYGYNSISFEPMEFLFYFYFINQKSKGLNKISIYEIISASTANEFKKYIDHYYPYYYIRETQRKSWQNGFDAKDFRSKRTKINQKINELIPDKDIASQFIIEVDKVYGDSKYFIPASITKIKIVLPQK
jgi:hypothetical protein